MKSYTRYKLVLVVVLGLLFLILVYRIPQANKMPQNNSRSSNLTALSAYPPPEPTPWFTLVIPPTPLPPSTQTPEPTDTPLPPTPPASSDDIAEIQAVIRRASELRAIAVRTFDISQFHTVYVNDPQTWRDPAREAFVQRVLPLISSRIPAPAAIPGALDYWRAYYAYMELGAERLRQRQLGTPISPRDGPIGPGPRDDPIYEDQFDFRGIWIFGRRAEAVVDGYSALRRYYLVKTAEGWRIAGQDVLKTHF